MADDQLIYGGTTIARLGVAALVRGRSGSGKSDLALRAVCTPLLLPGETVATPFQLVSDDMTVLIRQGCQLSASAPTTLNGKIEVRGIGIVSMPTVAAATLGLIVDLTDGPIERLPDYPGDTDVLLGVAVDLVQVRAFEASAPLKIALALDRAYKRLIGRRQAK